MAEWKTISEYFQSPDTEDVDAPPHVWVVNKHAEEKSSQPNWVAKASSAQYDILHLVALDILVLVSADFRQF